VDGKAKCAWTHESLNALRTLAGKAEGFRRPMDVPRSIPVAKENGRGQKPRAKLDGTNTTESANNDLETTMSASYYNMDNAHAYMMASAQRASIRGEVEMFGVADVGHCDRELCRQTNEVCRMAGFASQYPDVPELDPDTGARFGCQHFEVARKTMKGESRPSLPLSAPSSAKRFFQTTTREFSAEELRTRRKRKTREESQVEETDLDIMNVDMKQLCAKAGVAYNDDPDGKRALLARAKSPGLAYETSLPVEKRLCPPGGACCAAYQCRNGSGNKKHIGSHNHLPSCLHLQAKRLLDAAEPNKKKKRR